MPTASRSATPSWPSSSPSSPSLEPLLGPDVRLTWFEILTGAALRWFADRPVDVAVFEVGLGGRWDATNVADGDRRGDHQHRPRPHRVPRPDPRRRRRREGRDHQAGQRPWCSPRRRPDLVPIFERREAGTDLAAGPGLRRRAQRPGRGRPGARPADPGGAVRGRVPGPARPPPGRQLRRRPGRGRGVLRRPARGRPGHARRPPRSARPAASRSWAADPLVVLDGAKNVARRPERPPRPSTRSSASPLADPGGRHAAGQGSRRRCCGPWAPAKARLVVACPPPSPRAMAGRARSAAAAAAPRRAPPR